jgi:hypothetical protein
MRERGQVASSYPKVSLDKDYLQFLIYRSAITGRLLLMRKRIHCFADYATALGCF